MRIAVDINPLQTGHRFRGIGSYVYNLVAQLLRSTVADSLYLYHNRQASDYPEFPRHLTRPLPSRPGALPQQLAADQIEVLHLTDFHHPLFTREDWPELRQMRVKTVVTVYDLIPLVFPNRYPRERSFWEDNLKPVLNSSEQIIAISTATSRDLVRLAGIDPAKISVVHLGTDPQVFHNHYPAEQVAGLKTRYSLGDRLVLYVGGLDWRKNFSGLLEGFAIFRRQVGKPYQLVLAGLDTLSGEATGEIQKSGLREGEVHFIGYVPKRDLPLLYNAASIFAFPSLYEGFGLPLLEALACGLPAVACRNSSLPEFADGCVSWVEPEPASIAAGLLRLAVDQSYRQNLIQLGLQQAGRFTWKATALKCLKIYQSLCR